MTADQPILESATSRGLPKYYRALDLVRHIRPEMDSVAEFLREEFGKKETLRTVAAKLDVSTFLVVKWNKTLGIDPGPQDRRRWFRYWPQPQIKKKER